MEPSASKTKRDHETLRRHWTRSAPHRQMKHRRSEGRHLSLIHTVEKEKQDVMSHKTMPELKMENGGTECLLWFRSVFVWFF